MTTKMNENIDAGDIERVTNWDEIYLKVNKYLDSKNSTDFTLA